MEFTEKLRDELMVEIGLGEYDFTTEIGEEFEELGLIDGSEFLTLTDEEADERAAENIKETLWAFVPEFLSRYTDLPEKVFEALAELSEDANEAILALINATGNFEDFAEKAIEEDGREHFIAHYDSVEHKLPENDLYAYQIN